MTDTAEELRIIAKDADLSKADRETLVAAARELDDLHQRLTATTIALDESQGHRIAMDERYRQLKRAASGHLPVVARHQRPLAFPAMIEINGEQISASEAASLVRMLCNDAKQIAGEFHGMNRSAKFRANWPNEYVFADAEWKNFVEAVRAMYAARLGDPKTPPADARRMHLAMVLQTMAEQGAEKDTRLQIAPNSQQFVGDPFENRKIANDFGKHSNTFKDLLLGSARYH